MVFVIVIFIVILVKKKRRKKNSSREKKRQLHYGKHAVLETCQYVYELWIHFKCFKYVPPACWKSFLSPFLLSKFLKIPKDINIGNICTCSVETLFVSCTFSLKNGEKKNGIRGQCVLVQELGLKGWALAGVRGAAVLPAARHCASESRKLNVSVLSCSDGPLFFQKLQY